MMKYKGYTAEIEIVEDDKVFTGRVTGIRDVLHFQGTTFDELEKAFHETVDDYLKWCEELGQEPEKPYSGKFNVRVSPKLHAKIAGYARNEGKSLNQWIVDTLSNAVAEGFPHKAA